MCVVSAAVRDILRRMDNPGAELRMRPRRRPLSERLERARTGLLHAEVEWLLSAHLYAAPHVVARRYDRYARALGCYTALFERACAAAGIGGDHE